MTIARDFVLEKAFGNSRAFLLPQLLVRGKHVGLTGNSSYATGFDVTDVDTFVFIERDRSSLLEDFDLDRWDVVSRSEDHPPVTRLSGLLSFRVGLTSAKQESFFAVEDIDVLGSASLEPLSRAKKERGFSLSQFSLSELVAAVLVNRVQNDAELTSSESSDGDFTNNTLVYVGDVGGGVSMSDEPLLTNVSLHLTNIHEGFEGFEVESFLGGENVCLDGFSDFFVNIGKISTRYTHKPLFASLARSTRTTSTETKCLVRLNDNCANNFNNLDLHAWDVGTRTFEQPLVTSLLVLEITDSSKAKGGVRCHYLKWGNFAVKSFARVQGKGFINLDSNLFVSMSKGVRTVVVNEDFIIVIANDRVLD